LKFDRGFEPMSFKFEFKVLFESTVFIFRSNHKEFEIMLTIQSICKIVNPITNLNVLR